MTISREQMEAAIKAGGSVRHAGQLITRVEDLPSAEALDAHREETGNAALAALDAQLRPLQEQRAQLLRQQQEQQQARASRAQAGQQQASQQAQPEPQNAGGQPVYDRAELEKWTVEDLKDLAGDYELDLRQFKNKQDLVAGLMKAQAEAQRQP